MTVRTSRFTKPVVPGAEDVRTVGWWGMLFGIIALAHFVGAVIVAYLYLRAGAVQWPPEGVEPPSVTIGAVGTALTFVAAAIALFAHRWTEGRGHWGMVPGSLAIVVGSIAFGLILYGAIDHGVYWYEHSYGSVFWLVNWTGLLMVGSGVGMSAVLVAQHVTGYHDHVRNDEIRIGSFYWWFAALAATACFITAFLVPQL